MFLIQNYPCLHYLANSPISFHDVLCRLDLKGMAGCHLNCKHCLDCVFVSPKPRQRAFLGVLVGWIQRIQLCPRWILLSNTLQLALQAPTFPFLFSFDSRDLTEQTAPRHTETVTQASAFQEIQTDRNSCLLLLQKWLGVARCQLRAMGCNEGF